MKIFLCLLLSCLFCTYSFSQTIENQYFDFYGTDKGCVDPYYQVGKDQSYSVVLPPVQHLEIPYSEYVLSVTKPHTLHMPSGTRIDIPTNAFLNKNGQIIEGEVEVFYREFNNPLDIFLSGIPMTIEREGEIQPFQSAGMFELLAFQDQQEVFPNPNALIEIELNSTQLEDDYQLYDLDERTGQWVVNGKDEIIPRVPVASDAARLYPPRKPELRPERVYFKILKRQSPRYSSSLRKPQFTFTTSQKKWLKSIKSSPYMRKYFQELALTKKITWVYEGALSKAELAAIFERQNLIQWSSIARTRQNSLLLDREIETETIHDIIIEPNLAADNYWIHLIRQKDTVSLSAYPYFFTKSPEVEQKRNQKFYQAYLKNQTLRLQEWEKLMVAHQEALETYQVEKIQYDEWAAANPSLVIRPRNLMTDEVRELIRRRVKIDQFGIKNIDKLLKNRGDQIILEVFDEQLAAVKCESIYLLDEGNNAVVTYLSNSVRFVRGSKNSLVLIAENGDYAFVSAKQFRTLLEARKNGRAQVSIPFKASKELLKAEIKEALAFS